MLIVVTLITRIARHRIPVHVQDVKPHVFKIRTQANISPFGIRAGNRNLFCIEMLQRLYYCRTGTYRWYTRLSLDKRNHLLIPTRTLVETTGGASINDQVDTSRRKITCTVLNLRVHPFHARFICRVIR